MIAVRRLNHAPPRGHIGLYHLGWQVNTIDESSAPIEALDLPAELARWSGVRTA